MASPEPAPLGQLTMQAVRAQCGPEVHIVGVIGSPVAHSLSPLLHNTAFAALGLSHAWRSFAFEVAPGQAAQALEAMRTQDVTGLSVTMPHKADVAELVDECSDVARQLNAVNCVYRENGRFLGTNTDGEGFVASLARGVALEPAGKRCVVIGAGGAARAVMLALARAGASNVAVVNRTPERAFEAADLAGDRGTVVALTDSAIAAAVGRADLVVNATPVGMVGVTPNSQSHLAEWLVDPGLLGPGQVAADLVYVPRPTPWLEQAAVAGATTLDGLGMLVHQAAAQLLLWTGQSPPLEAMWHAAEAASPAED
ncbi:MAG TPA: shikimate dehydrogenase [Acidimicrobiales bacterium]|nr:shikimate dehydrogenase [Acidimicrobiales bacterium]